MSGGRSTSKTRAESRSDPKIEFRNVSKNFGRVIALDDVSLTVQENEILAIVGDNGAGKSTLMNILCGVHRPSSGQIFYEGKEVVFSNPSDARDLSIETVYQDLALMNDLSVARNLFMGKFPKKKLGPVQFIDWKKTRKEANRIVEQMNQEIDVETEVEFFSGGQRQLIAVGRALAFDPEVMILDEPTSALSVDATELVHEMVENMKSEGITQIIISHGIEDVLSIADRVAVLFQGRCVGTVAADETSKEALAEALRTGTPPDSV